MKDSNDRQFQIIKSRFKNLRESTKDEKGKPFSCRKLAEAMGDSAYYSKINQLERGEREPSIRDLKRYIEYFNVTFEYLTGISDVENYKDQDFVDKLGVDKNCLESGSLNYLKQLAENNDNEKLKVINTLLETKDGNKIIEMLSHIMFNKNLSLGSNYYSSSMYNEKNVNVNEIIVISEKNIGNYLTGNKSPIYLDSDKIKQILFNEIKDCIKRIDRKERFSTRKIY